MKISVLTPTFNRGEDLEKIYTSLVVNSQSNVEFEWLIMDDGSTDKTKIIVENMISQKIFPIKYFYQSNKGKMAAINNLMRHVSGDICFTCDSDDYLTVDCMDTIKKHASKLLDDETVYALLFLKKSPKGKLSGTKFVEQYHRSDMFSLYFREKMKGEKVLVFKTSVRQRYRHEIEGDEKFVTESRMYHKMDLDYDVICVNKVIEVGDYKEDGYTQNIEKIYVQYPLGFYQYYKEILDMDLKDVTFDQKIHIYKQYILFSLLAEQNHAISAVSGIKNKIIVSLFWIPEMLMTKTKYGKYIKPKALLNDDDSKPLIEGKKSKKK